MMRQDFYRAGMNETVRREEGLTPNNILSKEEYDV